MIRRGPRPDTYTVVDNDILRNHALSFKARGILAYLLSMPDHWVCRVNHLATVGPDGRDAVRTGLRELEDYGYITRHKERDHAGRVRTVTVVHDYPVKVVDKSATGNGLTDPGKPIPLVSTNYQVPNKRKRDIVTVKAPKLCTSCNGVGWTASPLDPNDVERCACNPKVAEL